VYERESERAREREKIVLELQQGLDEHRAERLQKRAAKDVGLG
jgi:hypothetical protein